MGSRFPSADFVGRLGTVCLFLIFILILTIS